MYLASYERGNALSIWFFINFTVILFASWKISTGYIGIHVVIGAIGLIFVFYNWSRHAVYSTIRSNISRKRKIKYAKLTRSVRKYHQWVGVFSLLIILFHAIFVMYYYNFHFNNLKMISGIGAIAMLMGVVITGFRRKWKKTHRRHKVHLGFGFGLFALVLSHLIL